MTAHLERAHVLLRQSRFELAEKEVRRAISEEPDSSTAFAFLSLCLDGLDRHDEALEAAETAVGKDPEDDFAFYTKASAHLALRQRDEARRAVDEAIRLDPEDSDYYALAASIAVSGKKWQEALDKAEEGLSFDPEHVGCTNMRAMALNRLGRREEAGMALEAALSRDPDNASTHANRGWALLQAGNTKEAMESFREALRLEPGSEWARQGIIEALKARNPFYRIMLKYFFFMTGLSARAQWGVILGLYFLVRILRSAARSSPALAPLVSPLVILYMVFAYCTWTAVPVSNLLLRLHPFGRYALSGKEVRASNWVGSALLAALLLGGAGAFLGEGRLVVSAVGCALFVIPLAATFQAEWEEGGKRLAVLTGAIALLGVGALGASFAGHQAAGALATFFFLGIFLFTWVANFLIAR